MSDNQVFILIIGIPFYLVGCLAVYAFLKEEYDANLNGLLQPVYIICIAMLLIDCVACVGFPTLPLNF